MVIVAGHITVEPRRRESYLAGCRQSDRSVQPTQNTAARDATVSGMPKRTNVPRSTRRVS
ncbi:MAG: hypothetical protein QOI01_7157 [Mycobacterium sp.]|jgi:hypothetical protein|nr:hypothetical protein [Mycobacterium sp.]